MLIGKHIAIIDAKNRSLIGKAGTVIDETKSTITIKSANTSTDKHSKDQRPKDKHPKNNRITIIKEHIITIEEKP